MERVEWSRRPADSRQYRAVVHLLAGALVAFAGLGLWLLGRTLRRLVAAGDLAVAGALVVLTLVGGWASVAYLLPVLADGETRARIVGDPLVADLRPGLVLVGAGLVAAVLVGIVALGVPPQYTFYGVLAPLAFYASLLGAEGAVDPSGPTVETSERAAPVDGLTGYRTVRVGDVVLVWLSYARGRGGLNAPHLLVVPPSDAPEVRAALDAIADPEAEPDPGDPGERRAVLAAGAGCLGGAAAVVVAPWVSPVPGAIRVVALPFVLLGGVFLAAAWLE